MPARIMLDKTCSIESVVKDVVVADSLRRENIERIRKLRLGRGRDADELDGTGIRRRIGHELEVEHCAPVEWVASLGRPGDDVVGRSAYPVVVRVRVRV